MQALKTSRVAKGLSLADVAQRSGIDSANLSRLENDPAPNPTWATLQRITGAIGVRLTVGETLMSQQTITLTDMPDLDHFMELADHGRNPGCSSGEWAALQLAQAITEHAPRLDDSAIQGLHTFIHAAHQRPGTCREIFGGLAATR